MRGTITAGARFVGRPAPFGRRGEGVSSAAAPMRRARDEPGEGAGFELRPGFVRWWTRVAWPSFAGCSWTAPELPRGSPATLDTFLGRPVSSPRFIPVNRRDSHAWLGWDGLRGNAPNPASAPLDSSDSCRSSGSELQGPLRRSFRDLALLMIVEPCTSSSARSCEGPRWTLARRPHGARSLVSGA